MLASVRKGKWLLVKCFQDTNNRRIWKKRTNCKPMNSVCKWSKNEQLIRIRTNHNQNKNMWHSERKGLQYYTNFLNRKLALLVIFKFIILKQINNKLSPTKKKKESKWDNVQTIMILHFVIMPTRTYTEVTLKESFLLAVIKLSVYLLLTVVIACSRKITKYNNYVAENPCFRKSIS